MATRWSSWIRRGWTRLERVRSRSDLALHRGDVAEVREEPDRLVLGELKAVGGVGLSHGLRRHVPAVSLQILDDVAALAVVDEVTHLDIVAVLLHPFSDLLCAL